MPPIKRLAQRVGSYFDRHPEASRDEFLLHALRREIDSREEREGRNSAGFGSPQNQEDHRRSSTRPVLSAEDIRIHAWLNERLAVLHHERHGAWPRLRRFFFGDA
jgi:hypothetical protein